MARMHLITAFSFAIFSIFIFQFLIHSITGEEHVFETHHNPLKFGEMKEKFTHFLVYWHDVVGGPKPTAINIVKPAIAATGFGAVAMFDNAMTTGPNLTSKLLGRAQGFYALASQTESGFLMAMNFVFTEGKYNGSSITILGRNMVFSKVREMPIIGGSGLFRFARGYVQARTNWFDIKSGDASVEYNVYVLHY